MGLRKAASQLLLHRPTSICTCLLLKNNTLLDLLKILSFVWWFVQNQVKSFTDNLVKKNILLIRLVLRYQKWIEMALTQMSIYTDLHVYRPVQKNKPKINHQKITHAKLMHHPTRDLESLYTCVHALSLHRIVSLLSVCYLKRYRSCSQELNFQNNTY